MDQKPQAPSPSLGSSGSADIKGQSPLIGFRGSTPRRGLQFMFRHYPCSRKCFYFRYRRVVGCRRE
jgi:hypothetical protein